MRCLDISFPEPHRNLACDEFLLNAAEQGESGETLRFWESPVPFVVLGVSQRLRQEVAEEACARDRVPILRRCSAGGCVLQGPGCLNYALVLDRTSAQGYASIQGSYCEIFARLRTAFESIGVSARHAGVSDLAIDGMKVSGNAQRRRKRFFLHHGTLLHNFDTEMLKNYLREPEVQPEYRNRRDHQAFVTNLACDASQLRDLIRDAFGVSGETQTGLNGREQSMVDELAERKYASESWNRKRL